MSDPTRTGTGPAPAPSAPASRPQTISDPREVAALVLGRINLVNARKDELTLAIHGLTDVTQQLSRIYGEQMLAIEQLRRRVKTLESGRQDRPPRAPTPMQ